MFELLDMNLNVLEHRTCGEKEVVCLKAIKKHRRSLKRRKH